MRFAHLATRLFNKPLLLDPEYAHVVTTVLAERLEVEPLVSQDVVERYKRPNDRMVVNKAHGIAVLPIVGGMVHRGDGPEAESGLQSYTAMQSKIAELVDDRSIRGILLDIDSGGGEVSGLHELSSYVTALLGEKPIWAIANTTAASAAYWLAASTDRIYAAPASRVGSIGVYVAHRDVSKQMEKRGVVNTFVYAGAKKISGNPFEALPEDVRADMQSSVNALWDEFADHVAARRDLTREQVQSLEAAVFGPERAYELGLVDGVATLGQVLSDFGAYLNRPRYAGLSMDGESMSANRLTHSDDDVAAARVESHAAGVKEGRLAAEKELSVKLNTEFGAVLAALYPDSPRAAMFVEALNEGASLSLATKMAAKIEDPKPQAVVPGTRSATAEAVDRLLANHTPAVGAESTSAGNDPADPKAKRLAELQGAAKAHNVSRGYRAS